MIRLIVRIEDANAAANVVGCTAWVGFRTFTVDIPEVEEALRQGGVSETGYRFAQLIGAELVEPTTPKEPRA